MALLTLTSPLRRRFAGPTDIISDSWLASGGGGGVLESVTTVDGPSAGVSETFTEGACTKTFVCRGAFGSETLFGPRGVSEA